MKEVKKKYDVYGIGTPMVDVLCKVENRHLEKIGIPKGVMSLIDEKRAEHILNHIKKSNIISELHSGGDCPNTISSIGILGGNVVFSGVVGDDEFGKVIHKKLKESKVIPHIKKSGKKTASCIIMVTPDTERSMNTHLATCELYDLDCISREFLVNSKYLYVTAYMLDFPQQKKVLVEAMKIAKKHNVRIAFDMADPFVVQRHKEYMKKLISEYVNVLFANEEESKAFTGESDYNVALEKLSKMVDLAVIKLASKGAILKYKNKTIKIKPFKVKAIDSTGAGDNFAAGFLYGLTRGYSIEKSGKIASYVSSRIVMKLGTKLDSNIKKDIEKYSS
jgi:sugar/nucleoside kinase (ribokinase family)